MTQFCGTACSRIPGLLISNIDIDVDIIDDTFDVSISISTILSYKSIDRGIDDTLFAFFYRHYIDTSQLTCKMFVYRLRRRRRKIRAQTWNLFARLFNTQRLQYSTSKQFLINYTFTSSSLNFGTIIVNYFPIGPEFIQS